MGKKGREFGLVYFLGKPSMEKSLLDGVERAVTEVLRVLGWWRSPYMCSRWELKRWRLEREGGRSLGVERGQLNWMRVSHEI